MAGEGDGTKAGGAGYSPPYNDPERETKRGQTDIAAAAAEAQARTRSQSEPGANRTTKQNIDGAFGGSFGASTRPPEVLVRPWYRRRSYFTEGWTDPSIWRAAAVELFATSISLFLSGQWGMTLQNNGLPVSAYVGIWNAVFLSVFIYAAAPASGGHLNPTITFATVLCGLCPLSRGTLYILGQTIGGALTGGILRGSWGYARAVMHKGGGNFFDPSTISPGNVLLIELYSTATLLFLAVGTGIDPRQATVFGPYLGPALVGLSFGIVTAATTNIAPGYTGANMNPARAVALSIAGDNWSYHWIWWIGPLLGTIILTTMYNLIPPSHAHKVKEETPQGFA